jgi:hypothetical protein
MPRPGAFEHGVLIARVDQSDPPTFRLRREAGAILRVLSVAVVEAATGDALWQIVPTRLVGHPELQVVNEVTGRFIEAPEAAPAVHAAARREGNADALALPLDFVTYSVVPHGFQQLLPCARPAQRLISEGSYLLQVLGAGRWVSGSCPFRL